MDEIIVLIVPAIIAVVLLIVLIKMLYVQAPPSIAYVLSGFRKSPRVLIGTGGFKVPFLERLDKVFLGQVTVDVKTSIPVPTHDFIDVMVDAVCKVSVLPDEEGTRLAAKNFLNMSSEQIAAEIKNSLEGNMREVVGAITLQNLITDRDKFSDEIKLKAAKDMEKLGLQVISCNIQNITDGNKLIENLGADNTFKIRKDAAITKANAERDIAIAESEAKKEANDVRVRTETEISERNNELAIKQADLKRVSDTKKAEADAAYEIEKQEQLKTINIKTVDARIEQTKREQILSEEAIKISENELKAKVNAQADADKYQTEIDAQAALEKQKREAEAKNYMAQQEADAKAYTAEQEARAVKAKADAAKYAALQDAAGIEAKGRAEAAAVQANLEAEAAGILAKGQAEAEAMQKKAEAYERYGKVAVIDMLTKMNEKVLPQVAENIAKPMSTIKDVKIYGTTGGEVSGISANVPSVMKQTFDVVKDVTGVDMADIMKSNAIQAKTDRNINVTGDDDINVGAVVK
ncbi:MAG: flotillin family protein [Paludibacteraceae bacterium]|nr:flotillin family protein [Paludibacteraceae bacterium]